MPPHHINFQQFNFFFCRLYKHGKTRKHKGSYLMITVAPFLAMKVIKFDIDFI